MKLSTAMALLLWAMTAAASPLPAPRCGQVCVRMPPTLQGDAPASSCYQNAPAGFELGHWYRTYTSFADYASIRNVQLLATSGQSANVSKVDYITYQTPNCSHLYTVYGYETPTEHTDVKTFRGVGALAGVAGPLEIVAYGYDTACDAYVMYYEPDSYGKAYGLVIISSAATGPTAQTLKELMGGVKQLGHQDLTTMAEHMEWIPYDREREFMPYPVCDEACLQNKNNPDPSGACPAS